MPRKKLWLTLAIAHSIFILILSFINVDSFPEIGSDHDDKIFHTLAYALLAGLWIMANGKFLLGSIVKVSIIVFLYGMIIEVCQGMFATHREFDIIDQFANSIGIALAVLAILVWQRVSVKKI